MMFVIQLLIIFVIGLSGFIIYKKVFQKESETKQEQEEEKEEEQKEEEEKGEEEKKEEETQKAQKIQQIQLILDQIIKLLTDNKENITEFTNEMIQTYTSMKNQLQDKTLQQLTDQLKELEISKQSIQQKIQDYQKWLEWFQKTMEQYESVDKSQVKKYYQYQEYLPKNTDTIQQLQNKYDQLVQIIYDIQEYTTLKNDVVQLLQEIKNAYTVQNILDKSIQIQQIANLLEEINLFNKSFSQLNQIQIDYYKEYEQYKTQNQEFIQKLAIYDQIKTIHNEILDLYAKLKQSTTKQQNNFNSINVNTQTIQQLQQKQQEYLDLQEDLQLQYEQQQRSQLIQQLRQEMQIEYQKYLDIVNELQIENTILDIYQIANQLNGPGLQQDDQDIKELNDFLDLIDDEIIKAQQTYAQYVQQIKEEILNIISKLQPSQQITQIQQEQTNATYSQLIVIFDTLINMFVQEYNQVQKQYQDLIILKDTNKTISQNIINAQNQPINATFIQTQSSLNQRYQTMQSVMQKIQFINNENQYLQLLDQYYALLKEITLYSDPLQEQSRQNQLVFCVGEIQDILLNGKITTSFYIQNINAQILQIQSINSNNSLNFDYVGITTQLSQTNSQFQIMCKDNQTGNIFVTQSLDGSEYIQQIREFKTTALSLSALNNYDFDTYFGNLTPVWGYGRWSQVAVNNNIVYLFQGAFAQQFNLYYINLQNGTKGQIPLLNTTFLNGAVLLVDANKLYITGGIISGSQQQQFMIQEVDLLQNTIKLLTTDTQPRGYHQAIIMNFEGKKYMYLFGGVYKDSLDVDQYLTDMIIYDLTNNIWIKNQPNIPGILKKSQQMFKVNEDIIGLVGEQYFGQSNKNVQLYNIKNKQWSSKQINNNSTMLTQGNFSYTCKKDNQICMFINGRFNMIIQQ